MPRILIALSLLCIGSIMAGPHGLARTTTDMQAATAPNEVAVVAAAPLGGFNRLMVTVTVCKPGTTTCRTIPNVMVDTGSTGLRLQAGMATGLGLPPLMAATNKPLAQCLNFVSSAIWGGLWKADVRIGGLTANNIAIQVAAYDGDSTLPRGSCPPATTVSSNGTLGIGWRKVDPSGGLFTCFGGTCQSVVCPAAGCHLPNPVSRFPSDNNGEVFRLPAARSEWMSRVAGRMIFGVNTASNNQIGTAAQYVPLSATGRFTTNFDHQSFDDSYIDSGTMYNSVHDDAMSATALCPNNDHYYCLKTGTLLTASFSSQRAGAGPQAIASTTFHVSSLPGPVKPVTGVHDVLAYAGPTAGMFVWGLPFFFGKQVALVQETETPNNALATGPFYAFEPYEPAAVSPAP